MTEAELKGERLELSKMQRAVLEFWLSHFAIHHTYPTLREACSQFGWGSTNAAVAHIKALVRKGYMRRTGAYASRSFVVVALDQPVAEAVKFARAALGLA